MPSLLSYFCDCPVDCDLVVQRVRRKTVKGCSPLLHESVCQMNWNLSLWLLLSKDIWRLFKSAPKITNNHLSIVSESPLLLHTANELRYCYCYVMGHLIKKVKSSVNSDAKKLVLNPVLSFLSGDPLFEFQLKRQLLLVVVGAVVVQSLSAGWSTQLNATKWKHRNTLEKVHRHLLHSYTVT